MVKVIYIYVLRAWAVPSVKVVTRQFNHSTLLAAVKLRFGHNMSQGIVLCPDWEHMAFEPVTEFITYCSQFKAKNPKYSSRLRNWDNELGSSAVTERENYWQKQLTWPSWTCQRTAPMPSKDASVDRMKDWLKSGCARTIVSTSVALSFLKACCWSGVQSFQISALMHSWRCSTNLSWSLLAF